MLRLGARLAEIRPRIDAPRVHGEHRHKAKDPLLAKRVCVPDLIGVADGTRTHDDRNHNPGLYQLSYSHLRDRDYSGAGVIAD